MNVNKNLSFLHKQFWQQTGQAMVEYTVVTVFGVLVLTTGPGGDYILKLTNAVRANYDAYSYAVSLSDYPDKENYIELIAMYNDQGMPSYQREYLTDSPAQLIEDLKGLALGALPAEVTGVTSLLDSAGLGLADFCSFCTGNPFDAI